MVHEKHYKHQREFVYGSLYLYKHISSVRWRRYTRATQFYGHHHSSSQNVYTCIILDSTDTHIYAIIYKNVCNDNDLFGESWKMVLFLRIAPYFCYVLIVEYDVASPGKLSCSYFTPLQKQVRKIRKSYTDTTHASIGVENVNDLCVWMYQRYVWEKGKPDSAT